MRSTAKIVFGASFYNSTGASCYNWYNVRAARTDGSVMQRGCADIDWKNKTYLTMTCERFNFTCEA